MNAGEFRAMLRETELTAIFDDPSGYRTKYFVEVCDDKKTWTDSIRSRNHVGLVVVRFTDDGKQHKELLFAYDGDCNGSIADASFVRLW
jgi:hypothetical protein